MKIYLSHISKDIIEMTCESNNTTVTETITDMLWSTVDEQFISELEQIVQDLKDHNESIKEANK